MRIDVVKDRPELYRPSSTDFVEIEVPPLRYLCIDGEGDPNTSPACCRFLPQPAINRWM